jgi:putative oxidoreductase
MKITSLIARILLGLLFTIFGLNGFLHFIPTGPAPTGHAGQFFTAVAESHYMDVVFALQLIAGLLVLANQFLPLALTVLAPIIVNIILFHATMAPEGLPLAAVAVVLWLLTAYPVRSVFTGLLKQKV